VYWIPVYQILESRGLEVGLVNAQHVKNVPGRKTDVSDCQWLQYLHSVGLLRASFRPPGFICAIRALWRHRSSLIQMAVEHVLHMQKAFSVRAAAAGRLVPLATNLYSLCCCNSYPSYCNLMFRYATVSESCSGNCF
jgi:transposase